jgi:hypothetical protein
LPGRRALRQPAVIALRCGEASSQREQIWQQPRNQTATAWPCLDKPGHTAAATSSGSFPITEKNALRSKATARSVFGLHRPAMNSRYRSTSRSPSR